MLVSVLLHCAQPPNVLQPEVVKAKAGVVVVKAGSRCVYFFAKNYRADPPSKRILVTNEVKLYADMLTLARRGVADIIVPPDSPKHEFSTIDEFVRCGSAVGA